MSARILLACVISALTLSAASAYAQTAQTQKSAPIKMSIGQQYLAPPPLDERVGALQSAFNALESKQHQMEQKNNQLIAQVSQLQLQLAQLQQQTHTTQTELDGLGRRFASHTHDITGVKFAGPVLTCHLNVGPGQMTRPTCSENDATAWVEAVAGFNQTTGLPKFPISQ